MEQKVVYRTDVAGVDWHRLKAALAADHFDNGRTPEQLRASFENSFSCVFAYSDDAVVGTARALSDGVCNAYVVDLWTQSRFRLRGIARAMMEILLSGLPGQHVSVFSDDASGFYTKLGFLEQPAGLGRVVGTWLNRDRQRQPAS